MSLEELMENQELEIKGIADNDTRKRIEKAGKGKNVGLLVVEKTVSRWDCRKE